MRGGLDAALTAAVLGLCWVTMRLFRMLLASKDDVIAYHANENERLRGQSDRLLAQMDRSQDLFDQALSLLEADHRRRRRAGSS